MVSIRPSSALCPPANCHFIMDSILLPSHFAFMGCLSGDVDVDVLGWWWSIQHPVSSILYPLSTDSSTYFPTHFIASCAESSEIQISLLKSETLSELVCILYPCILEFANNRVIILFYIPSHRFTIEC